jgi:translocator protein
MTYWEVFVVFFALNFGGILIGGLVTAPGVVSDWHLNLKKAPWTPPGFVFSLAWMLINLCLTFFMANFLAPDNLINESLLIFLFAIQWILSVSWNFVFFKYHNIFGGLLILSLLVLVVSALVFFSFSYSASWINHLLILPYLLWLLMAFSLNLFIYLKN